MSWSYNCTSSQVKFIYIALFIIQIVSKLNAAARLLTGTRKYESITPILFKLHWLPVKFRIDFKILLFVYKALNNLAPQYLTDLLCPYTPSRTLRSSDHCLLIVPRSRLKKRGDRAFAAAGPKLWNSLPLYIRLAPSVSIFKSSLKTFLFSLAFHAYWLWYDYCLFFLLFYFFSCFFCPVLLCILFSAMYSTLVSLGCF